MGISKHELHEEFPQFNQLIDQLRKDDPAFRERFAHYAKLDQEIEGLELRDSPIGDDSLHQLKQERLELKDDIYKELVRKSGSAG
ncbi:YdcH family protein [Marinobacter sp. CHS3-4]|uniref:YdcH family protein n=1 Tax=Marinobacter sp. CHS3-4 TaxID=3045174 RepID=UPI0024B59EC8|nr:YdcH family protein [Marinobacter sp. CHS3-4]MDI9244254.1 YdcH family protein [Marinobacter sp. CHS3-4]